MEWGGWSRLLRRSHRLAVIFVEDGRRREGGIGGNESFFSSVLLATQRASQTQSYCLLVLIVNINIQHKMSYTYGQKYVVREFVDILNCPVSLIWTRRSSTTIRHRRLCADKFHCLLSCLCVWKNGIICMYTSTQDRICPERAWVSVTIIPAAIKEDRYRSRCPIGRRPMIAIVFSNSRQSILIDFHFCWQCFSFSLLHSWSEFSPLNTRFSDAARETRSATGNAYIYILFSFRRGKYVRFWEIDLISCLFLNTRN